MKKLLTYLLFSLIFAFELYAWSSEVTLKSGKVYRGEIKEEDDVKIVFFDEAEKKDLVIPRSNIKQIKYPEIIPTAPIKIDTKTVLYGGLTAPLQMPLKQEANLTPSGTAPLGKFLGYGLEAGIYSNGLLPKKIIIGMGIGFVQMQAKADIFNASGSLIRSSMSFTANEGFAHLFMGYSINLNNNFSLTPTLGFNGGYIRVTDSTGVQVLNGFIPGAEVGLWAGYQFTKLYLGLHYSGVSRLLQGGDIYLQHQISLVAGVRL